MQRSNSAFYAVSIIVIIILASFYFSWKMMIPKYKKNKVELKKLEQEIISANAKLESLRTAKKDIDDVGPIFDQIFVAMPKDKDEPNIISEVEAIVNVNHLTLPGIQISENAGSTSGEASQTGTQGSSTGLISFTVNGSFEDIGKLTKSLESDLKFMNIKVLTLSSGTQGLTAAYQIEVYRSQGTSLLLGNTQSATAGLTTEGGL
jgi:Tfp pilus assembly protein PilO